jgi:hypothetical protein
LIATRPTDGGTVTFVSNSASCAGIDRRQAVARRPVQSCCRRRPEHGGAGVEFVAVVTTDAV